MKLSSLTPVAAVLAVSLTTVAHAETSNPFMAKPLSTIVVAGNDHEGKCGSMKKEEGKCGGKMMEADTDKDGKISKAEFMTKHEAMFSEADTNKDGMLDAQERKTLRRDMMKKMKNHKEGKCGEGKCGANK